MDLIRGQHIHHCMKCSRPFYCLNPTNCKAWINVLPRVAAPAPDGGIEFFDHVCSAETSVTEVTENMIAAAEKYFNEQLGYCIHSRNDFVAIYKAMEQARNETR
jgi:hypothetical protein